MDMSLYLTAPLQIDKICRACLLEKGDMRPLFGACLDEMLHNFASVKVSQNDGFPHLICVQCVLQCSRAYTFKQLCEKSDAVLRHYVSPEFQEQIIQHQKQSRNQAKKELEEQLKFRASPPVKILIEDPKNEFNGEFVTYDGTVPSQECEVLEKAEAMFQIEQKFLLGLPSPLFKAMGVPGETFVQCILIFRKLKEINLNRYLYLHSKKRNIQMGLGKRNNTLSLIKILDGLNFMSIGDDYYTVVETVETTNEDSNNDDSINNDSTEDNHYKIDISTIKEISEESTEVTTTSEKKQLKYKCTKCDAQFPLRVDLKVHMMTHPKDLDYVCEICTKAFPEARILKRHQKIHLNHKPHQCDQCDMSFAESSNLSKHKKKHTGELRNIKGKPHLCSVCGRAFKWASSLHKHMKYHTGHKLLNCNICPKQYVEARSLKIHLRSHTGERPYICEICQKSFTQSCNLEKHIRVHTGEKPYICPVCNKGFSQSGYVAIHMRTHTGDRPYVCQTCGKAFSGSNTLTLHQRIHTGEKPYNCDICGKNFSRHETLVIHVRSHTGDRPHICLVCNKGFTSSGQLSGHMKTHTGEKPHGCDICGKKFSGTSSLKVHMKSHLTEKEIVQTVQYTCKLCNKNFDDDTAFNRHILEVHAIQATTIQIKGEDLENIETMQVAEIITTDNQTIQVQTLSQI